MTTRAIAIAPQVENVDARGYRLRHVLPDAAGAVTVLSRTYAAVELPVSTDPTSADLVQGQHTARLGDAGEASATFPNGEDSEGRLWRERFSTDGHLEWLEVYRDDVLESVINLQRAEVDRGQVVVGGPDGMALLRKAYEPDRLWHHAPHDVIENYTRVRRLVLGDDFDGVALNGSVWSSNGDAPVVRNGRVRIGATSPTASGSIFSSEAFSGQIPSDWRLTVAVANYAAAANTDANYIQIHLTRPPGFTITASIRLFRYADTLNGEYLELFAEGADLLRRAAAGLLAQKELTFVLERQGRWIRGYCNGILVGYLPAPATTPDDLIIQCGNSSAVKGCSLQVDQVVLRASRPFLSRSASDKGDYVLPGAYPTGGLHGHYYDDKDLQGLAATSRRDRILTPAREPYTERLDAGIVNLRPPAPGSSGAYWSARWTGSVYLPMSLGNQTLDLVNSAGCRIWVGKTMWGEQAGDEWPLAALRNTLGVATQANLGTRDGWYPLVIEYHEDAAVAGPTLMIFASASYTDPGGTVIATGGVNIPVTSLSPLGCFEQRVQGSSHFDLVQSTTRDFGYQLTCEPMSLESGEFPGRLVPRVRVGRDTDVVLEVDDTDAAEPVLSPSATTDAADLAVSLRATGAGIADGQGSQVTAEMVDITAAQAALFELEAWVDAGDIGFADLLGARLAAELALRESPWQEVRGTPRAQERLADTWPLTGALAAMRWRPGDGVRLLLPDVGVEDASPRQLVQVTRTFGAEGRTGTEVGWRQRPKSPAVALRRLLRASVVPQRSYQGQYVTLLGTYVVSPIAAGGFSGFSIAFLYPGDRVVRAVARIPTNTAGPIGLEINSVDRTAALGGGWSGQPLEIDILPYATQASIADNRLYVRVKNNGAGATTVEFQLIVEVVR